MRGGAQLPTTFRLEAGGKRLDLQVRPDTSWPQSPSTQGKRTSVLWGPWAHGLSVQVSHVGGGAQVLKEGRGKLPASHPPPREDANTQRAASGPHCLLGQRAELSLGSGHKWGWAPRIGACSNKQASSRQDPGGLRFFFAALSKHCVRADTSSGAAQEGGSQERGSVLHQPCCCFSSSSDSTGLRTQVLDLTHPDVSPLPVGGSGACSDAPASRPCARVTGLCSGREDSPPPLSTSVPPWKSVSASMHSLGAHDPAPVQAVCLGLPRSWLAP